MDEQKIIADLSAEGYDKVWIYEADPNEVDEEHEHNYDTQLVILAGQIQITSFMGDKVESLSHSVGSYVDILRNTPHSAKVGPEGCRYVVAEKY